MKNFGGYLQGDEEGRKKKKGETCMDVARHA